MVSKHYPSLTRLVSMLVAFIVCATLSACGSTASQASQQSRASSSNFAYQSPSVLIAQLRLAKATDESSAKDPTISVVRRGDFLEHAMKADQVIRALRHGSAVAQDDVTDALEVPPKHIMPAQRTALIQQLRDAIRKDDIREQAVVAFSSNIYYQDPDAPSEFGYQEQSAYRAIGNLQAGNHVSWDELQQALYIPPDPL